MIDDLHALENAAGEDQRSAPQPLRGGVDVVHCGRALGEDEQIDGVAKEPYLDQVGMRLGIDDHAEVHGPLDRRIEDRARRGVGKAELDARIVLEEPGHPLRQEVGAERFVTTDDEAADFVGLQPLDPLLDFLEARERFVGEAQELLARTGQGDARAQANQQLGPEALLELFDDRRQAGLADLKDARGGGETSAARYCLEVTEMLQHDPEPS